MNVIAAFLFTSFEMFKVASTHNSSGGEQREHFVVVENCSVYASKFCISINCSRTSQHNRENSRQIDHRRWAQTHHAFDKCQTIHYTGSYQCERKRVNHINTNIFSARQKKNVPIVRPNEQSVAGGCSFFSRRPYIAKISAHLPLNGKKKCATQERKSGMKVRLCSCVFCIAWMTALEQCTSFNYFEFVWHAMRARDNKTRHTTPFFCCFFSLVVRFERKWMQQI